MDGLALGGVEQARKLAPGMQEPAGGLDPVMHVPWVGAEPVVEHIIGGLIDPVLEQQRGLHLAQELVVAGPLVVGDQHLVVLLELHGALLDAHVRAAQVEQAHVRGGADRVQELERCHALWGGLDCLAEHDSAGGVDVELAGQRAEGGGLEALVLGDEALGDEEVDGAVDAVLDGPGLALVGIQGAADELVDPLLGAGVAAGDGGQDVHAHGPLLGQLGLYGLGLGVEVAEQDLFFLVDRLGQGDRFAVGVVLGSPGPTGHLLVLQHRDGHAAHVGLEAPEVPDDHAACRQVEARGQGGRGCQEPEMAVEEELLDQGALLVGQAGVVEGRAVGHRARQALAGRVLLAGSELGGRVDEVGCVLLADVVLDQGPELLCDRLGALARVDEDDDLAALGEGVLGQGLERVGHVGHLA